MTDVNLTCKGCGAHIFFRDPPTQEPWCSTCARRARDAEEEQRAAEPGPHCYVEKLGTPIDVGHGGSKGWLKWGVFCRASRARLTSKRTRRDADAEADSIGLWQCWRCAERRARLHAAAQQKEADRGQQEEAPAGAE